MRPPRRPCADSCGAAPRSCRGRRALLAVALGQQHAELGRDRDHERAERDRHRVQRNPDREQDRAPTSRSPARSAPAARARGGDRRGRRRAARARPRPGRRAASPGAARGRRPASPTRPPAPAGRRGSRCTPAGGCRLERICSISCCCWSRPIRRMPNASVATRRLGVITSCEKYGGITLSRPLISRLRELRRGRGGCDAAAWRWNRSGSEKAGHRRARCRSPAPAL